MRRLPLTAFALIAPVLVLGCPSETPALCDNGACDSADGSPDGTNTTDGGGDAVGPPPGCDPAADPKDAPKCVVSDYGIFVDATTGSDTNTGSKELPVKTITNALTKLNGRPRIYVCEGTYPESVKLTTATSIFGGFACGTWDYTGNHAKVSPGVAGAEAVLIENVKSSVVLADLHGEAAPGDAQNKNSVAMRIVGSTDVKLVRMKATAGAGFKGNDGTAGSTTALVSVSSGAMSLAGNAASGTAPGALKTCTCTGGVTTSGGTGGPTEGAGQAGAPSRGGMAPVDGAGGTGKTNCSSGGFGHMGADAPAASDALPSASTGLLGEDGVWKPASGNRGSDGLTGQGGGGGGGRDTSSAGGGGGCGGCGGTGGGPGTGGGASIALVVATAKVDVSASSFVAADGGAGGKGAAGGNGGDGGSGASGGPTGCQAGDGGKGGNGGAGSGGAGGISVGVLFKGAKPTLDAATDVAIAVGAAGMKGAGGALGVNDGPDGVAEKVLGL